MSRSNVIPFPSAARARGKAVRQKARVLPMPARGAALKAPPQVRAFAGLRRVLSRTFSIQEN